MPEREPPKVRITLSISKESAEKFKLLALRHGLTQSQEFEQIVTTVKYIEDEIDAGGEFRIKKRSGEVFGVDFHAQPNPDPDDDPLIYDNPASDSQTDLPPKNGC